MVTCRSSFHHRRRLQFPDLNAPRQDRDLVPMVIEINGLPSMQLSGEMGSRYTRMKLEMLRDVVAMLLTPPPVAQLSRLAAAMACVGSSFAILTSLLKIVPF